MQKIRCAGTIAAGGTTVTVRRSFPWSGMLRRAVVVVPALDGATTLSVSLVDDDGIVQYTKGTLAGNGVRDDAGLAIPLVPSILDADQIHQPGLNLVLLASGAQTPARDVVVYLFIE